MMINRRKKFLFFFLGHWEEYYLGRSRKTSLLLSVKSKDSAFSKNKKKFSDRNSQTEDRLFASSVSHVTVF